MNPLYIISNIIIGSVGYLVGGPKGVAVGLAVFNAISFVVTYTVNR